MATSRRFPIGCTLGLMLGSLAVTAQAEPPSASNNGLMSFPNVRVENAPVAQPAATAKAKTSSAAAGMKAYRDDNGTLREPMSTDAPAASTTRARVGVANAKTAAVANAEPTLIQGPAQAVGVALDDEFMVSAVVHRDANGKLTQQCVTGETNAAHTLHSHEQTASKENNNER